MHYLPVLKVTFSASRIFAFGLTNPRALPPFPRRETCSVDLLLFIIIMQCIDDRDVFTPKKGLLFSFLSEVMRSIGNRRIIVDCRELYFRFLYKFEFSRA